MRTEFDFTPLFRSSVGFDRMLEALRAATRVEHLENYPPYDIEKVGEDDYRVTLAVAGFRQEELNVSVHPNVLVISGERRDRDGAANDGSRQILHRGIATRAFERRFELADHVQVVGASLSDGLLTIDLRREVPEAMRPRRIEISSSGGRSEPRRQIEGTAERTREAA